MNEYEVDFDECDECGMYRENCSCSSRPRNPRCLTKEEWADIERGWEPKPPASLDWRFPICPHCYHRVYVLFIDTCVKKCEGSGIHTLGWNGQHWLPEVEKFCIMYGLTERDIIRKKKDREFTTEELINS
jgi:hypothetical protein